MTDENHLSPGLAELERALRGGPLPGPALGDGVIKAVREELRRSPRRDFRQYAAGLAAGFLLAANLSLYVSSPSRPVVDVDSRRFSEITEQIEQLELPLSKAEIRRQGFLLAAGENITPMGRPYGTCFGTRLFPE